MISGRFYIGNGIFFLKDSDRFPVPLPYEGELFFVNETCISVLAMHEQDGKCKISLGRVEEIASARIRIFGIL